MVKCYIFKQLVIQEQCSFYDFSKWVTAGASAKLPANVRKPPDKFWPTLLNKPLALVTPALVTYFKGVKIDSLFAIYSVYTLS